MECSCSINGSSVSKYKIKRQKACPVGTGVVGNMDDVFNNRNSQRTRFLTSFCELSFREHLDN
jgi:hypothetical protein